MSTIVRSRQTSIGGEPRHLRPSPVLSADGAVQARIKTGERPAARRDPRSTTSGW